MSLDPRVSKSPRDLETSRLPALSESRGPLRGFFPICRKFFKRFSCFDEIASNVTLNFVSFRQLSNVLHHRGYDRRFRRRAGLRHVFRRENSPSCETSVQRDQRDQESAKRQREGLDAEDT